MDLHYESRWYNGLGLIIFILFTRVLMLLSITYLRYKS